MLNVVKYKREGEQLVVKACGINTRLLSDFEVLVDQAAMPMVGEWNHKQGTGILYVFQSILENGNPVVFRANSYNVTSGKLRTVFEICDRNTRK